MATDRDFNTMLNEHLNYDLLKAEMAERCWLYNHVEKDETWKGGTIPVPFKGSQASNIAFGGLTDASDVGTSAYVRGQITAYKEMWGTLKFQHTDLIQHDGKVSEASFLKLLPAEIDDFMKFIKERASLVMLNGYATKVASTATGDASGNIVVEHPERLTIGEKVYVDDGDSAVSAACYVRSINMETGNVELYDARSGGSAVNLSGYAGSAGAALYYNGTQPGTALGFSSLRDQLLSSANGGASSLFGQTKTAYPYLQAINTDGSAFTQDNILSGVFNKWVTVRNRCSDNPRNLVASYKNGGAILKCLENSKGGYNVVPGSRKTSAYGWDEVEIGGPKGVLKLVMVQEQEDDVIFMLSDKGIKFHSNGAFKKRVAPDGKSYYETRATTGYSYLVDIMLFGELACYRPSGQGVIHSIDFELDEA